MGITFMGVWPVYSFLGLIEYPGAYHSLGVTSLFIGSFALGFLLTALPRFTGSESAKTGDLLFLFCISLFELILLLSHNLHSAYLVVALKFLYFISFAAKRLWRSTLPLPASFVWIGFALLGVITGALSLFLEIDGYALFSRVLIQRGLLTGLFVGVGGRLMPFLTGMPALKEANQKPSYHLVLASLFFFGLGVETLTSFAHIGLMLQALSIFCELSFLWGLYHLPSKESRAVALWISSWLLFLGPFISSLWPAWTIHFMHLTFLGCFAAGTIAVASHVSVSHRGLDRRLLITKRPLGFIFLLLVLASITRVLAPTADYLSHLGYAGILAIVALLTWTWYFLLPRA